MMEHSPLTDVASDLAQAAFELVGQLVAGADQADVEPVFLAIRRFYLVHHAHADVAPSEADICDGIPSSPTSAPSRFKSAITVIEPGVFDPAVIARYILSACEEVSDEGNLPVLDPAVRLMASKLAWLCTITANMREVGGLIFDCTRETFGR